MIKSIFPSILTTDGRVVDCTIAEWEVPEFEIFTLPQVPPKHLRSGDLDQIKLKMVNSTSDASQLVIRFRNAYFDSHSNEVYDV